ncbi:phage tail tape measure protein [Bacillus infantis]|uniref:phage tail tape measure protein n=1 Tax=Bacillus infantis TaxID=324767 RepID=UPI003CE7E645
MKVTELFATAIGQVTRESGSVIGNSLKSIYSRITSIQPAIDSLAAIGVNIRTSSGEMRRVEDILQSLSTRWSDLSSEQRQNLGLQIAGRYQLSRFLILMDQFEEAQKASTTALNSEGSAYRENEAFLDSYQAKLNQLANSWTTLSTTMGEKVLGSGIVVVSESLTSIANATSFVVDKIGLLPPLFTIAGAAFLAFNNHTRTSIASQGVLATSLVRTGDAMTIATGRSRVLQQQLYNLTLAGRATAASFGFMGKAMGGALSFLTTAALPLAAFAALGAAISYATNKVVEHRQAQKESQEEIDKLTKSYGENETQIESLISRYEQLDKQVKSGSIAETDSEYLKVQQDLYTLLPSVAASVDEKGQAHLRSADAIRQEVGYLKELSKVDAEQFINDFQSKLADLNDKISETQDKLNEINERQNSGYSELIPWFGVREKAQLEDMADSIIGRRDIEAKLEERKRLFQDLGKSYATYYGVQSNVTEEDQKYIDTIVTKNSKLLESKKGIKEVENQVKAYIGSVGEIRKVSGNLFDTERIQHLSKYNADAVNLFNEMSTAMKNGNQDWDKYGDSLEKVGFNGNEVTSILNLLKTGHDEATGATIAYVDASEEAVEVEEDRRTSAEKLAGVTGDQIDSIYELIGTYQLLSDLEADNKNKSEELLAVTDQLAAIYPHLAKNKKINIEAIQAEAKAQDILLKAIESLTQGKLTKEQQQTVVTALQAKKRIDILKKELAAQQAVVQKFNEMSKTLADNANTLEQEKLASRAYDRAKQLTADIDLELPDFNAQIDALGTVIDYRGREAEAIEKQSKANEKQNKAYESSTYVTDKFRQALEKLNLQLEKQRAIKAKFPEHSKEYQNALQSEINLMKEQVKLYDEQSKSLDKQIKSGKIQEVGKVVTTSSPSTSASTTNSYASGGSTSAQVWNFFKSKGFTDNIVAGIMGNLEMESRLNPNAINKSSGATGIAQWLGGRKTNLSNFAKQSGTSMYDLNTQLNFLWKELNGSERRTMSYLQGNQSASASQVAAMFDKLFERSEGTHIPQRQKYANQFLSQFAGTTSSVTNTTSASESASEASKLAAENLSSIDQAKSDLLQLQQDIINTNSQIAQLEIELVNAQISTFERKKVNYDQFLENSDLRLSKMADDSKAYRDEIAQQKYSLLDKQKVNEDEIKFLRDTINSNKLSAAATEEFKVKLHELGIEKNNIILKLQEIEKLRITNILAEWQKGFENLAKVVQNGDNRLKKLSTSSREYRAELEKQISATSRQTEIIKNQMAYLSGVIAQGTKNGLINPNDIKELNDQLHQLGITLNELQFKQQELGFEKIQSIMKEFSETIDDLDYKMDRYNKVISSLDSDSEDYRVIQESLIPLLEEKAQLIYDERKAILDQMKSESLSIEQKKELAETLEDLSLAYWDVNSQLKQMQDNYNKLISDSLSKIKDEYLKGLREESDKTVESLEKAIETAEDYYNPLIEKQQERLKQLGEEIEKEDRLQRLREINSEIQKVRNDKRFSYIDATGKEILTYDKGRVSELEKERDELLKQYEREDVKKAIQDEIDRLEKAKNDKVETLREEIEEVKKRYDQLISEEEKKWDELIEQAGKGTLDFSTIMDEFYGTSLTNLSKYVQNVQTQIQAIKDAYASLSQISVPEPTQVPTPSPSNGGGTTTGGSIGGIGIPTGGVVNKPAPNGYTKLISPGGAVISVRDDIVDKRMDQGYKLAEYHDGGIVGNGKTSRLTELANKLFNKKPGEQIIKSLNGELQIPPKNIANGFKNIGNLVNSITPNKQSLVPVGDTFQLNNVTIQADNPQDFMQQLRTITRMNKR